MTDDLSERAFDSSGSLRVILQSLGDERVLAVGPRRWLEQLGDVEIAVPDGLLDAVRTAAALTAPLQGIARDLSSGAVRLTSQAKALLAEHGPMLAENGAITGVVRGADGKFRGLLSFEEVTTLASVSAQLPAIVGAVALQAQLSVIERKLNELQTDVSQIIRDGQIELLAEAKAVLGILDDVHDDVAASGFLTDDDWARISVLELPIKRLHHQTRAQLEELGRTLGQPDAGMGRRLVAVAGAVRNDRMRFWFHAHVVAEVAITRWELLRIHRLVETEHPHLERETAEAQESLEFRHRFVGEFASGLASYIARAGRFEGLLDRLRFIKRARLVSLILELDEVLVAYRSWTPAALPPPEAAPALTGGSDDRIDWDALVAGVKRHARTPVNRVGEVAGSVALAVGRRSKDAVGSARQQVRRLRGSGSAGSQGEV